LSRATSFESLEISEGRVGFRDGKSGFIRTVKLKTARATLADEALRFEAEADVGGGKVRAEGSVGTAEDGQERLPVSVNLAAPDASTTASGNLRLESPSDGTEVEIGVEVGRSAPRSRPAGSACSRAPCCAPRFRATRARPRWRARSEATRAEAEGAIMSKVKTVVAMAMINLWRRVHVETPGGGWGVPRIHSARGGNGPLGCGQGRHGGSPGVRHPAGAHGGCGCRIGKTGFRLPQAPDESFFQDPRFTAASEPDTLPDLTYPG
jgi:hypothetical protein